jgi:thiosulfate dehydrogenase [quinone] large subunit
LKPFVYGLGYFLVLTGITLLLGVKSRLSLVVMTLTYMALSFGAGLLASAKTSDPTRFNLLITMLFIHIFMTAYALTLTKHEKLALLK